MYKRQAMDRAMEGGVDDVGIGVLFGLDKFRYEFAGLLMHAEHLEAAFGVGDVYKRQMKSLAAAIIMAEFFNSSSPLQIASSSHTT